MNGRFALVLLVAGFVAATTPVWAADPANPALSPATASPGQTVSFSGTPTGGAFDPGTCDVVGPDSEPLTHSCSYDSKGLFSGWVEIPTTVTPGTPYLLSFCAVSCLDSEPLWFAQNAVTVALADTGVVPHLHCLTYHEASDLLFARGLRLPKMPFPWWIGHVAPTAGTTLPSGATVTPYPLLAPSLTGMPYSAASAQVRAACATPVLVGPSNGIVVGQAPGALQTMPSALEVRVTVSPTGTSSSSSTTGSSSEATSLASASTSTSQSGHVVCCANSRHDGGAKAVRLGAASAVSVLAVAGSVVMVRRRRLVSLQPVVEAAGVVVTVSGVRPTRQVTEGRRGRIAASVLAVRRRRRTEIEEQS